jgi:putative redox protein
MVANHLKKNVNSVKVLASGTRRDEHPTAFESITLELLLNAPDIEPEALEKTIQIAKDTICPVWAMVKNNVEIVTEYSIISS